MSAISNTDKSVVTDRQGTGPQPDNTPIGPGGGGGGVSGAMPADTLFGNNTASPAPGVPLTVAQSKALLAIAQADVAGLHTSDSPTFVALKANSLTALTGSPLTLSTLDTNQNIVLSPNGTGALGLGTTSPQQMFELRGTAATAGPSYVGTRISADASGSGLLCLKARGTTGTPDFPSAGDVLLTIGGGGWNGTSVYTFNKAIINLRALNTWVAGGTPDNSTDISFQTVPSGSTSRAECFKMASAQVNCATLLKANDTTAATTGGAGSFQSQGGGYFAKNLVALTGATIGTAGTAVTNMRHGVTPALVLGTKVVSDAGATANTRYFFTTATLGTITVPADYYVSARSAGVSFTITSNAATDTSTVNWLAIEP